MNEKRTFLGIEFIIFLVFGIITLMEILFPEILNHIFNIVKDYLSWFIGISFGFVFSNTIGFLKQKLHGPEITKKFREQFIFFLLNLIILTVLTITVKNYALYFFNNNVIMPFFHLIFLQWVMIIYLIFKIVNRYEISTKYFITNELIILLYTCLILLTKPL